jgi:hypothetical protein
MGMSLKISAIALTSKGKSGVGKQVYVWRGSKNLPWSDVQIMGLPDEWAQVPNAWWAAFRLVNINRNNRKLEILGHGGNHSR